MKLEAGKLYKDCHGRVLRCAANRYGSPFKLHELNDENDCYYLDEDGSYTPNPSPVQIAVEEVEEEYVPMFDTHEPSERMER